MSRLPTPRLRDDGRLPIIGTRFDRLLLLELGPATNGHRRGVFLCDCGTEKSIRLDGVVRGVVKSCGCYNREQKAVQRYNLRHGGAVGGRISRLYGIWRGMQKRTTNPNERHWHRYGGKGIRVEWPDFASFQEWALVNGYADDLTIDRIDSSGNYAPDNCRWITLAENGRRGAMSRWGAS